MLASSAGAAAQNASPLAVRGVKGMPWGVSGCGKQALVGNVSDGDLLLGSIPSSSLLILHVINHSELQA